MARPTLKTLAPIISVLLIVFILLQINLADIWESFVVIDETALFVAALALTGNLFSARYDLIPFFAISDFA